MVFLRLELITQDRLKIFLDKDDLKKYCISFITLDYKNKKTRDVFWEVINIAKEQTGFDPSGGKLLIEAFPETGGALCLYVTKLARSSLLPVDYEIGQEVKKIDENVNTYIFRFAQIDDLLDAVKLFISDDIRIFESSLYEYEENLYIKFSLNPISKEKDLVIKKLVLNLLEYGNKITNEISECFLNEHATILIKNSAIQVILDSLKKYNISKQEKLTLEG